MYFQYETMFDIKSRGKQSQNPFILKIAANSTSDQVVNLMLSAHIIKKISLVDISENKQNTQIFRQNLLNIIENSHINLQDMEVLKQIVFYLQYWHDILVKNSSWLHTRTCFYYIQNKLKKNKLDKQLDRVKMKRAILQPNKKQFLSQIMGQNIYTQQLKRYVNQLKQNIHEDQSDHSKSKLLSENKIIQQVEWQQIVEDSLIIKKNILYEDKQQSWLQLLKTINTINNLKINQQLQKYNTYKYIIQDLIQTYLLQKLPIVLKNQYIIQTKTNQQKILKKLVFIKNVIVKLQNKYLIDLINPLIMKIKF